MCTVTPCWEETFQLSWDYLFRYDDATQALFNLLGEGPKVFVKRILNFIRPHHVRGSVDKFITTCSGFIQGDFSIPGFRWGSYTHADLGGVALGRFRVVCSRSLQHLGKVMIYLSKCKRNLAETL